MKETIIIIGAGPAGLTSAYLLAQAGYKVIVYESEREYVGGLSRTVNHKNFKIDVGGHRFFSKDPEVKKFWSSFLGEDFTIKKRSSKIFYNNQFFKYPLSLPELIGKTNPFLSFIILLSYAKSQLFPPKTTDNYENWMIKHFGRKLYLLFFKSYTEKVWGIPCDKISPDWAIQRINNLNIKSIFLSLLTPLKMSHNKNIKSLIEEFEYPRLGPGMLWEKVRDEVLLMGGEIHLNSPVMGAYYDSSTKKWEVTLSSGTKSPLADHLISSIPLKHILEKLTPAPPELLMRDIGTLSYREFVTIAIMFKGPSPFPDNWIYIQDGNVRVARIQNYKNWSSSMVPGPKYVSLGLEYYCQENDDFWTMMDSQLFKFALSELEILKIPYTTDELDYKVIRAKNAYPIYDLDYREKILNIQKHVNQIPNLHLVGRAGLHRYNNQDHSIKTAMLTCENIKLKFKKYDPWMVNQDAEYIESISLKS